MSDSILGGFVFDSLEHQTVEEVLSQIQVHLRHESTPASASASASDDEAALQDFYCLFSQESPVAVADISGSNSDSDDGEDDDDACSGLTSVSSSMSCGGAARPFLLRGTHDASPSLVAFGGVSKPLLRRRRDPVDAVVAHVISATVQEPQVASALAGQLASDKLASMNIKDVNKLVKAGQITKEAAAVIKSQRRRMKNREAANVCRFKRQSRMSELEEQVAQLQARLQGLEEENARLRAAAGIRATHQASVA